MTFIGASGCLFELGTECWNDLLELGIRTMFEPGLKQCLERCQTVTSGFELLPNWPLQNFEVQRG